MQKYHLNEIGNIAKHISMLCTKTILLQGELGSGKTLLSREVIRDLLNDKSLSVTSPTFNIVNIYGDSDIKIAHFDLYRIKSIDELYEIGMEEMLNNFICIIEWPQIVENTELIKSRKFVKVIIEDCSLELCRNITIIDRH